jgi:hypothetical protein
MKKNENKELSLRGAAGDVAIPRDKVLSFLSRCCASANQGIFAPARVFLSTYRAASFLI